MRDNHVNNFRKLTQDAFQELLGTHSREKGTFLDDIKRQYEDKHPGDVSYVQIDLSSLLVSHIPQEFTPLKVKDPKLLGRKGFGRYGHPTGIEDLSTTSGSKQVSNARVNFSSNLDAAISLLVDWL